jgi:hypothetical protein
MISGTPSKIAISTTEAASPSISRTLHRAVSGWLAGSLRAPLGSFAHALLCLGRDVRSSHRLGSRLFSVDVRGARAEQFAVQLDGCAACQSQVHGVAWPRVSPRAGPSAAQRRRFIYTRLHLYAAQFGTRREQARTLT